MLLYCEFSSREMQMEFKYAIKPRHIYIYQQGDDQAYDEALKNSDKENLYETYYGRRRN